MTNIAWTNQTWNPTVGCSLAGPGCTNCYAMKWAERLQSMVRGDAVEIYDGVTMRAANGAAVWTGKINVAKHKIQEPLRWRKPRRVFVNSMSDVFHENVPDAVIHQIWAVMALAERHTFQVLTKRAARMRDWLNDPKTPARVEVEMRQIRPGARLPSWPLANAWVGVSIENQTCANERVPILLECQAAVRFVSAEPLLGPIDLDEAVNGGGSPVVSLFGSGLHWVIVGGESGKKARPMHTDWARALRDACDAADIAFFFKQVGAWSPERVNGKASIGLMPDGQRVDATTAGALMLWKVGAKRAGELLDGQLRQSYPVSSRYIAIPSRQPDPNVEEAA